jgi:hypothetical protein
MRAGLASSSLLCLAALLGFAPLGVLAADPPAPGAASTAPATPSAVEHAERTLTPQEASAGPDTSADKLARHPASARKDSAGRDASTGHAASDGSQHGMPPTPGQRDLTARPPLDLSAPPMSHLMTPEQVQALIGEPDDPEPEEVMVEQGRYQDPVPQGQIPALAWALLHPLQAWRIFAPVTDQ